MAGLYFCFLPLTMAYTVSLEVFSLNNLICSVLVDLTLRISTLQRDAASVRGYTCLGALFGEYFRFLL